MTSAARPDPSCLVSHFLSHLESELASLDIDIDSKAFRGIESQGPVLADESTKAILDDRVGRPRVVLLVSPASAPGSVARTVERCRQVAERLGPKLGSVVVQPVFSGEFEGRSYAVLPWQRTVANAPWLWQVQRVTLAPRMFRWLRGVLRATTSDLEGSQVEERVSSPLELLACDSRFSAEIRQDAESALTRLAHGRWRPRLALVHGDLWKGNILLPPDRVSRRAAVYGFRLTDWGGAQLHGIPYWDFAQLASSFALPLIWARREIGLHASLLDCEPRDALCYLSLGIADLGGRLEHMPVELYVAGAERLHRFLRFAVDGLGRASALPG